MKKVIALVLIAMFAFVAIGCGDDDDGGGACTEADATACADDYTTCMNDLDVLSETYVEDAQACADGWCDCLDSAGCDEYLEQAGC